MSKLFLSQKQVAERLADRYHIQHNILKRIDVEMIPHYGWLPCFSLHFEGCSPISPHNNVSNLGYILHYFMQLFDVKEDGEYLSTYVDKQVRLIFNEAAPYRGECIGMGHPWRDKFIFFEDLMKVKDTKYD